MNFRLVDANGVMSARVNPSSWRVPITFITFSDGDPSLEEVRMDDIALPCNP